MSIRIADPVVSPGSDRFVEEAWAIKERIRRERGVFQQEKEFFFDAYGRSRVYCYRDRDAGRLIGYAVARYDGYMLFLAVDPDYHGDGYGRMLVERLAADYDEVTCHVRATNDDAIGFYNHVGFDSVHRVNNYYEDAGDAYYLLLDGE